MPRPTLEITAGVLACVLFVSQNTATHHTQKEGPHHVKINDIPARPDDVATIDGIMKAYYEVVSGPAGQPRKWDRDHSLYIRDVRFVNIQEAADGKISARSLTHQEFVDATDAALGSNAFYEREVHRIMHRFGNVAHVLSTAEQRIAPEGPARSHSIDSVELFWDGHRWWITSANIWPGDTPGRPLTKEFLP
jgi:hypothetical protein